MTTSVPVTLSTGAPKIIATASVDTGVWITTMPPVVVDTGISHKHSLKYTLPQSRQRPDFIVITNVYIWKINDC